MQGDKTQNVHARGLTFDACQYKRVQAGGMMNAKKPRVVAVS